jgi:nitrogen fixation/metabolism regulation signal transduction histidine kinase
MTRSISRPIEALARTSEKIARGDLKAKIGTAGNDEVSSLARSLQKMLTAMRERMEFNDALIRNIVDAQVIANNEGTLVYANGPTMKLFEDDFSSIVGKEYTRFLEGLPVLMEVRSDLSCKCTLLKKSGEKADVLCRLSVIKNGEGRRTGTMIMIKEQRAI